jgi:phosphate transport system permease protein
MLTIMIIPTIMALTLNALENTDTLLLYNSMALGTNRTRAIHAIYRKEIKKSTGIATFIAVGRAFGETMALSMILQSQTYDNAFNSFSSFFQSNVKTVGVLIATELFSENSSEESRSMLFAFGLLIFIVVLIINSFAFALSRKNRLKSKTLESIKYKIKIFFLSVYSFINNLFIKLLRKKVYVIDCKDYNCVSDYVMKNTKSRSRYNFWDIKNISSEIISYSFILALFFWVVLDILIKGTSSLASDQVSLFSLNKNTTGQALMVTIIIIFSTLFLSIPISLFFAIYLNEFAKNKKVKSIMEFTIDSLGAIPSIIFGMFGLAIFIYSLQLTNNGAKGKSLIAGALTLTIVVIPSFTRSIQQSLITVPMDLRINSYALGVNKTTTIFKIVLPKAYKGIIRSIILSIGRILAETGPVFLTAGLAASAKIDMLSGGQTLTTRIYSLAMFTGLNLSDAAKIMYECAFISLFLVILLNILPDSKSIYYFFKNKIVNLKGKKHV